MLTIAESSDCPVSSRGGSAEPIETTGRLNTGVASVDARVNEELALSVVGPESGPTLAKSFLDLHPICDSNKPRYVGLLPAIPCVCALNTHFQPSVNDKRLSQITLPSLLNIILSSCPPTIPKAQRRFLFQISLTQPLFESQIDFALSTIPALRAHEEHPTSLTDPNFESYDRYERYDHPTTLYQRQQQHHLPPRTPTPLLVRDHDGRSTPSSHRSLRRTPKFEAATSSPRSSQRTPRRVHLEAVSVGISPIALFSTAGPPGTPLDKGKAKEVAPLPEQSQTRQESTAPERPVGQPPRRILSQDLSEDPDDQDSTAPAESPREKRVSFVSQKTGPEPHPVLRISKHTHSAILWALEEALRYPNPFTPDLIEESASMADLLHGGPATTNGQAPGSSRPTAPPAPVGSPASGIRGPKMIMQERREREQRRKDEATRREAEAREREELERDAQADQEQRIWEERERQLRLEQQRQQEISKELQMRERERRAQQQQQAAGADIPPQSIDPAIQRRQQRAAEAHAARLLDAQRHVSQTQGIAAGQQLSHGSQHRRSSQTQQPGAQHAGGPSFSGPPPTSAVPAPTSGPGYQTAEPSATGANSSRPRNSFPHAFERWEALSAHWEGLTSFWIRRLQQHTEEIERDPLSQQLARQNTDLSAAGANLFHAVVELQRLRASSERKFQRWFFETRTEIEKLQEQNAILNRTIEEERQQHADAIRDAVEHEGANSKIQRQLAEMRKELLISKEEARRAWEELGRREEAEREWTQSLQHGLPTSVGGVQVVPMNAGIPSRNTSTRDGAHQQQQQQQPQQQQVEYGSSAQAGPSGSHRPASSGSHSANMPPTTSSGGQAYYQPQMPAAAVHEQRSYGDGRSEGGYSEGEYAIDSHGNFIRDSMGNKIPFRGGTTSPAEEGAPSDLGHHMAEDYDMMPPGSSHSGGIPPALTYPPPPREPPQWQQEPQPPSADYAGQGYGAPGWETVPRHRHPTRLSVIEEDERSRASKTTSQISRP
ncbi:hypothetical protein M0657_007315 [Pyricularia oryzae]|nr:hypothetical protein M9X92_006990 [Pyricularia oryzae]KAI7919022.1 hypothetical protein M0657_007315 [Pyricularia oryzae]